MLPMESSSARTPGEKRRIAVVGFPGVQILDVSGPLEVFSTAGREMREAGLADEAPYALELIASQAGPLQTSSGIPLVAGRSIEAAAACQQPEIDTLIVAGGEGTAGALRDSALVDWLRRHGPRARRLASVCSGAFLLGEAGLLDGRRATTHWKSCALLAERYPQIDVASDPIFVKDGAVYSSAGVCAGMDLALALVEEDHGRDVALAVARRLVLFLQRPGGQSQFSAQLASQLSEREPLRDLQAWVLENPSADLSVDVLARRVAMSPRNFARVFAREVGTTPGRWVERARVEAARRHLEQSDARVAEVAARCGFGTAETMRRAFVRGLRVSPNDYRHRFRTERPDARGSASSERHHEPKRTHQRRSS